MLDFRVSQEINETAFHMDLQIQVTPFVTPASSQAARQIDCLDCWQKIKF